MTARYQVEGSDFTYPASLKGLTEAIAEGCAWADCTPVHVLRIEGQSVTVAYTVPVQPPKPPRRGFSG